MDKFKKLVRFDDSTVEDSVDQFLKGLKPAWNWSVKLTKSSLIISLWDSKRLSPRDLAKLNDFMKSLGYKSLDDYDPHAGRWFSGETRYTYVTSGVTDSTSNSKSDKVDKFKKLIRVSDSLISDSIKPGEVSNKIYKNGILFSGADKFNRSSVRIWWGESNLDNMFTVTVRRHKGDSYVVLDKSGVSELNPNVEGLPKEFNDIESLVNDIESRLPEEYWTLVLDAYVPKSGDNKFPFDSKPAANGMKYIYGSQDSFEEVSSWYSNNLHLNVQVADADSDGYYISVNRD